MEVGSLIGLDLIDGAVTSGLHTFFRSNKGKIANA